MSKVTKKRVSRKLKSSWRKHIDISDVEQVLENQREDERIANLLQNTDNNLVVDEKKLQGESLRERRRRKFLETPRALLGTFTPTKVNTVVSKKKLKTLKPVKTNAKGKNIQPKKPVSKPENQFSHNLWASESDGIPELDSAWVGKEQVIHNMNHTGKPTARVTKLRNVKPKTIDAIEMPLPGISYNPAIDDYIELKNLVVDREQQIRSRDSHLNRVVTKKLKVMNREQEQKLAMKEMSEGLLEDTPISRKKAEKQRKKANGVQNEESDDDYKAINPPVVNKKKDRATRNKQNRLTKKLLQERDIQKELKKVKDISKIDELNVEVDRSELKTRRRQANRAARAAAKTKVPGRIANLQYEDPELDFVDPSELPSSLRTAESVGTLLAARFKSLQKRNIIAPIKFTAARNRTPALTRMKRFVLNSHKELID